MNLITVLGFLAHGYATGSFEVTEERLGVYLPVRSPYSLPSMGNINFTSVKVEHIDNPKGYADGEDARAYHPKLRGPVDPIEYAVDPRTGMKNYIANETGHWDTSKAHVRRTLDACIRYGREYRKSKKQEDKWEAYRLLGSALHTLEDFPAHSNFCELALISQGYTAVFPHVGSNTCNIYAPNGKYVFPLVTGTFGGSDFVHSLLGEATDHISSASVSDLSKEVANANGKKNDPSKNGVGSVSNIKDLVNNVPGLSTAGNAKGEINKELDGMDRMKGGPKKNPNEMTDNELRNAIWPILLFRDNCESMDAGSPDLHGLNDFS
ncbi:hypothetical protein FRC02_012047 [Tulasnella sp. 418]|nr:hypothetical protein FRC02_012047 [Tulasnella sp. 418]